MSGKRPGKFAVGAVLGVACVLFYLAATALGYDESNPASYLPVVYKLWPPPTPTPSPGRLLITEVLFNPVDEPDEEWEIGRAHV